jgi:hypothetical protein
METLFIYLLKSSGLVTLFFLAYYFLLRRNLFTSNRWFCWPVDHFRHSAFIGFHEDRLGGTKSATIDWSQIPLVFPLKTSLRWIGFDCGNRLCPGNSRFFNPIWIGLLQ